MSSFSLALVIKSLAVASTAAVAICWYHHSPCCGSDGSTPAVQDESASADWKLVAYCVEARSASVFAGACHYNGELMTQGNEALLAISVESGSRQGVDLAGVSAAALVSSDKNLKLGGEHRCIIYVSQGANAAQKDSIVALLKERSHGDLGEVIATESVPLLVRAQGNDFEVTIGDQIELKGMPMPDRACCKMPNLVWYEPLVPLKSRVVGFTQEWRVKEPRLNLEFKRADENSAFIGRLSMFDGACAGEPRAAQ